METSILFARGCDGDEDFNLTILYGSRNRAAMLFQEEFKAIMEKTDKVKLVNV